MAVKKSAAVVLLRDRPSGPEIFLAQRALDRRFMAGFHAFFTGSQLPADPDLVTCAARELFEEAGLLATTTGFHHIGMADNSPLGDLRRRACQAELDFETELASLGLSIDRTAFESLGSWLTPPWLLPAYETEFFAVVLPDTIAPDDVALHLQTQEFATSEWVAPARALAQWTKGQIFLSTPIERILHAFAHTPPLPRPLQEQSRASIEICGGLRVLPLRTPTLLPATHTNCLVVGHQQLIIIDPGAPDADELLPLWELVDPLVAQGARVEAILLTHEHPDHVGGAPAAAERYNAPIWAHEETADALHGQILITRHLHDQERIELDGDQALICLHTPGHARGHLCLWHEPSDCLLAADMVAATGTIVVAPPDGNMKDYMASLRKLRATTPHGLLPAHGWLIATPEKILDHYIEHRLAREATILTALQNCGRPVTLLELVRFAYADVPAEIWPLAQHSLFAHLEYLVEQGRVAQNDDLFSFIA